MSERVITIEGQDKLLADLKRIGNVALFDKVVQKQAMDTERKLKRATFTGKSTRTKTKRYITDVEGMGATMTTLSGTGHLKKSWFSVKLGVSKWAVFNAIQVGNAKYILAELLNLANRARTPIGYRWKNFIDDVIAQAERDFEIEITKKVGEITA